MIGPRLAALGVAILAASPSHGATVTMKALSRGEMPCEMPAPPPGAMPVLVLRAAPGEVAVPVGPGRVYLVLAAREGGTWRIAGAAGRVAAAASVSGSAPAEIVGAAGDAATLALPGGWCFLPPGPGDAAQSAVAARVVERTLGTAPIAW